MSLFAGGWRARAGPEAVACKRLASLYRRPSLLNDVIRRLARQTGQQLEHSAGFGGTSCLVDDFCCEVLCNALVASPTILRGSLLQHDVTPTANHWMG
jgi:hypothetical protein